MLNRYPGDRHLAGEDLEDPIEVVPVDDRAGCTLPLMLRLRLMSRSPVASLSSSAPGIVSTNIPQGRTIILERPRALAATIAERSEMWPEASFPVFRFTATVSKVVLTLNVERTRRVLESLQPRPHDSTLAFRRSVSTVKHRMALQVQPPIPRSITVTHADSVFDGISS